MIFHQLLRTCHHTQRLISVVTCHVFVVDIIMFIKRFVVFSTLHFWHEFVLCVSGFGLWLVQCWVMVGTMLHYGWRFMLDQRVSNEQSNVGSTKYVAVGPTLNQRFGFGWRMVIVLAGTIPFVMFMSCIAALTCPIMILLFCKCMHLI